MKPTKVFVPFRFKTRNVSNAAELFRFWTGKSKKFQQVYINFIKIFGSNIGKLSFLPVILNLKINFPKVNQCGMKYNETEFYTRQIELNSVKQWNCRGPKPIVLIKNKSSLILFSTLSVNLLGWLSFLWIRLFFPYFYYHFFWPLNLAYICMHACEFSFRYIKWQDNVKLPCF